MFGRGRERIVLAVHALKIFPIGLPSFYCRAAAVDDRPREAARKDVVPGLGLQTARPPSPRYSLLVFAANLGHTACVSIVVSAWLNSNSHRGTTYKMVDRIPIENKTL